MSDKCLVCDWDFSEHKADRAKGNTGEYFCKWCTEGAKEELTKKLATQLVQESNISEDIALDEANKKLESVNIKWI